MALFVDEIDQAFPPRSNLAEIEALGLFNSLVQLRSLIQEQSLLSFLCAGVDPAMFESPLINGRDNLLYKLVRLSWLAPMSRDEMAEMVRTLGRRMGVRVRSHLVIDRLFDDLGGHPLLTRTHSHSIEIGMHAIEITNESCSDPATCERIRLALTDEGHRV